MGNLDVDALFINIPLDETINICTYLIYNENQVIDGISKLVLVLVLVDLN